MILIVHRWIICAYEQIPHRDMSVFCVRICTGIPNNGFGLPILGYLCILDFVIQNHYKEFLREYAKTSTSLLRICVYARIIQCWKTLLSKIAIRNFCARKQKTSTSLFRVCVYAQRIQCWNPKSLLGISAHVRKKLPRFY